MAALRSGCRTLLRAGQAAKAPSRGLSTKKAGVGYSALRPVLLGGVALGGSYGIYKALTDRPGHLDILKAPTVSAAGVPTSQDSVYSQTKNHGLFLWIHLKPEADPRACAKAVSNMSSHVDAVTPPSMRDEEDEIWAGVGFGPNFYARVGGHAKKNYNYAHRNGALGPLPSSGGDIFIHAKCNTYSKLFELTQRIVAQLPAGSVESYEDIYSFVYKNGRDLSGFIDGTENAADDDDRQKIAVEKETGGSYVVAQKWVHKMKVINSERDGTKEKWVGRTLPDSTELHKKSISSHVARMTGGNNFQQKKPFEIVRQSMPYGNVHNEAGLFFIGYSASPENLDFMLDRMVGAGSDSYSDDIMRLTECVKGTYWYFPGKDELKKLA